MRRRIHTGLVSAAIGALLFGAVGLGSAHAAAFPIIPHPAPIVRIPPVVVVVPTGDLRGGPLHENGGRDVDVERSTHHGRVVLR